MENVSSHKQFILDGFNELGVLRPVLFIPFFIMLVVSLSANSMLHMYNLMAGMACVDLSQPVLSIPNMLLSFLFVWRGISLIGCLSQIYFVQLVAGFQSTVWMALGRYFAICTPLHYHERMALP
ncbi:hypothetical protein ABVT39_016628 [Epinephelus coioides]